MMGLHKSLSATNSFVESIADVNGFKDKCQVQQTAFSSSLISRRQSVFADCPYWFAF